MQVTTSHGLSHIVNAAISLVLASLVVFLALYEGRGHYGTLFAEASLFYYLGCLLVLAYLRPGLFWLSQGLIWICEHFSFPKGRFMALVYASLFFAYAAWITFQFIVEAPNV